MLPAARAAQIALMDLPSDAEMVRRTRRFVMASGMTSQEMADAAGLSSSSLRVYLAGSYGNTKLRGNAEAIERTTRNMRAILKEYLDTHELHDVVRLTTPYKTADFVALRKAALKALELGTAYVADGPPGTQKSFSLLSIQHEINTAQRGQAVYVYARQDQKPQSFLQELCVEAGLPSRGAIDQLLRKLRYFLGNRRVLLMVDEAQHLPPVTLEVLRQLLDRPPYFGVVLAGSHSLSQRLSAWNMEQWRSRLRKTFLLAGPSEAEAREILRASLPRIPATAVAEFIAGCRTDAVRFDKNGRSSFFSYISARMLFDAIADAQRGLAAKKPNGVHIAQPEDKVRATA